MTRLAWAKLGTLLLLAVPLGTALFSTYRLRLESEWRMDPVPFALFLVAAFFAGRVSKRL